MPGSPRRKKTPARFSEEDFEADSAEGKDGSLFIWTIIILVLIGFAIACWIGSFYVFGHPEKPFSYQILSKLKKLEPPKRFELTMAPRGEFLRASQLLERYGKLTPRELDRVNETLLRNYLRNYRLTADLVPYVVGTYNILDSYELTKGDFFTSGVVAVAQSKDTPSVLLEQVFTCDPKAVHALQRTLLTGLDIDLKRENELSALIHVDRLPDGRIKATAISILYPSYESATSAGTFSLDPPTEMNVQAGLPVVTASRQSAADQKHASYKKRAGLQGTPEDAAAQNRLMRVERPVAVNLPTQPEVPTAPAAPVLREDAPVRPAIPVNEVPPQPTPEPVVAQTSPTPLPSPSPAVPSPTATPAPIVASSSGSWPVYAPGQMPRGRLLAVRDMPDMAGNDMGGDRAYLQGNFLVTAAGPNRAVLRTQGAITESLGLGGRASNVRIIVEYPAGSRPPAEGATFSRDARRPFQIMEIRRGGADDQVNVYVREVTRP